MNRILISAGMVARLGDSIGRTSVHVVSPEGMVLTEQIQAPCNLFACLNIMAGQ